MADAAAPRPVVAANLAVRFLLELAALVALAAWGVHAGHSALADLALGVGTPMVAAVIWGVYAAPKSPRRLHGPALVVLQLAVLGAGAAALAAAGHEAGAAIFAVVVMANAALLAAWGEA